MQKILLISLFLFVSIDFVSGQKIDFGTDALQIDEKKYPSEYKSGEITLKSSKVVIKDKIAFKAFEIDVPAQGTFYLELFVHPLYEKNNKGENQFKNLLVLIDDEFIAGKVNFKKEYWHSSPFSNGNDKNAVTLSKGVHKVVFTYKTIDIPSVETVLLSSDKNSAIDEKKFEEFVQKLKLNKLPSTYLDDYNKYINGKRQLDNPSGNYKHELDVQFTYSYFNTYYLTAGQTVTFETRNSTGAPVMHLFKADNPTQTSISGQYNNGSIEAKITTTISQTGSYSLLLRASSSPYSTSITSGVSDLYKDGSLVAASCPSAGSNLILAGNADTDYNYFVADLRPKVTSYPFPDSRLFLIFTPTPTNGSVSPYSNKIMAYNDDYTGTGDFNWGLASRFKPTNVYNFDASSCFVCSYSPQNPVSTCDLYMNCKNVSAADLQKMGIPNLKADDAIMTAPETSRSNPGYYNCFAWAGGVNFTFVTWKEEFSYWYDNDQLKSFDNWFGNTPRPRYSGAWDFTRTGANANNAVIDLWATMNGSLYTVSHASVRKPGNDHPHGYDWESKNGDNPRFMHPRESIAGGGFGQHFKYYIDAGTRAMKIAGNAPRNMSFQESVALGYSKIAVTALPLKTNSHLTELLDVISIEDKAEFDKLYQNWKNECKSKYNSLDYGFREKLDSYKTLIDWLKSNDKKFFPLIFDKFLNGGVEEQFSKSIIQALTFPEYKPYWETLKKYDLNPKNWYDKNGTFIVRTPEDNCRRYLLEILPLFTNSALETDQLKVYPNPITNPTDLNLEFNLEQPSEVTVSIYDVNGTLVNKNLFSKTLTKGRHKINVFNSGIILKSGVYLLKLNDGFTIKNSKITITN